MSQDASAEPVQHTASLTADTGRVLHLANAHLIDLRPRRSGTTNAPAPATVPALAEVISTQDWRVAISTWGRTDALVLVTDPTGVAVGLHLPSPVPGAPAFSVATRSTPPLLTLFTPGDFAAGERYTRERDWAIATRVHAIGMALFSHSGLAAQNGNGDQRWIARTYEQDLEWAVLPERTAHTWREAGIRNAMLAEHYATDGWTPQDAAPWITGMVDVSSARLFATAGWTTQQALALIQAVARADTSRAEASGVCQAWVDGCQAWVEVNLSPQTTLLAVAAGLRPEEARDCAQRGELDEAGLRVLAVLC